ncbi:uncharacterized protein DMAD_03595 [Drosophila madeirensis]|uniref:Uncharacterized protein n=2 Tax=Drosophila madeirensis TaxID=30013 RepID=A0AAU9G9U8_DROMD
MSPHSLHTNHTVKNRFYLFNNMRIIFYFVSLTLTVHLYLWFQLPCIDARSVTMDIGGRNSTSNGTRAALKPKTNATTKERPPSSSSSPSAMKTIKRIRRARTDLPKYKFTFDESHLPCDYDVTGSFKFMNDFPKYCRDSYQQRFMSEAEYRMYMLYQTEGFFFGQYHERLIRFEKDTHTFDYRDTGF